MSKRKYEQISGSKYYAPKKRMFGLYGSKFTYKGSMSLPKTSAMASNALKMVKKLKKEIEKKEILVSGSGSVATDVSTVKLLNPLAQGNSFTTRIGNKVTFKSLALNIKMWQDSADTLGCVARIVVVYDRDADGTACAWNTVFQSTTVIELLNRTTYKGKRKILFDQFIEFPSTQQHKVVRMFINLKDAVGDYSLGNVGDITDIKKGSIYLMIMPSGNENNFSYVSRSRVIFEDM